MKIKHLFIFAYIIIGAIMIISITILAEKLDKNWHNIGSSIYFWGGFFIANYRNWVEEKSSKIKEE